MAKYDPDRIAELAAGLLEPVEAAALEQEIAADPRAAAELAAQRLALEALRRAPAPVLSAEERTELRRAVAAALNLEEAPAAAVVSSRRRVPWRPLAVAAAALAIVAAVVPLAGLLSVGEDQTAMTGQAESDVNPRIAEEEAADEWTNDSLVGDAGTLGVEFGAAMAYTAQAIDELLADPADLIAAADTDFSTCRAEAEDLLGKAWDPAGAALPWEPGEVVVWFVLGDGATVQSLAVFDPAGCVLLASRP
ncbi:MAG: hypothetical protein A2V75_07815 [Actinobacteria bacterium RBG_16_70_17]|nr:MAG: hypothetical protein A2V75_07815 [Actinobacteria bacterium RBG_16_70_17]